MAACGAVIGRLGRCRNRATTAFTSLRVVKGKTQRFTVNRCDMHPLRGAVDATPIVDLMQRLQDHLADRKTDRGQG